MVARLTGADLSFVHSEGPGTPQHIGGLAVFDAPDGLDYDRLTALLEERTALAPRYRQRMQHVPAGLGRPVWADDPDFEINYHVRRCALPRPGDDAALLTLCGRIQSRPLDRDRPLWEAYLVEGLTGGRVAVITKTHPSMVDGAAGTDITEVLLDASPRPRRTVAPVWAPRPDPSRARLALGAVGDLVVLPGRALAEVRSSRGVMTAALRLGGRAAGSVAGTAAAVSAAVISGVADGVAETVGTRAVVRRADRRGGGLPATVATPSPLRARPGAHRRVVVTRARLDDLRAIRGRLGGSVNDVVLALVAGAVRGWLLERGELLSPATTVRALSPVGIHDPRLPDPAGAAPVRAALVDLPVGERDPVSRLAAVRRSTARLLDGGHPLAADVLAALSGFAPSTLHALGVRAAHGLARHRYALTVTNVPGPQVPLYAAGARMREMFPILPLAKGRPVAFAVTSYDGGVFFGVNTDRDAVPDVALLTAGIDTGLSELLSAIAPAPARAGAAVRPPALRRSR